MKRKGKTNYETDLRFRFDESCVTMNELLTIKGLA